MTRDGPAGGQCIELSDTRTLMAALPFKLIIWIIISLYNLAPDFIYAL